MQLGFFDIDDKYTKLTKLGDPLAEIDRLVDFSIFEEICHIAIPKRQTVTKKNPKGAGRNCSHRKLICTHGILKN